MQINNANTYMYHNEYEQQSKIQQWTMKKEQWTSEFAKYLHCAVLRVWGQRTPSVFDSIHEQIFVAFLALVARTKLFLWYFWCSFDALSPLKKWKYNVFNQSMFLEYGFKRTQTYLLLFLLLVEPKVLYAMCFQATAPTWNQTCVLDPTTTVSTHTADDG